MTLSYWETAVVIIALVVLVSLGFHLKARRIKKQVYMTELRKDTDQSEKFKAFNYCVSFIDLLGQREAARGQGLLPDTESEEDHKAFQRILRDNIGGILQLQRDVEEMVKVLAPDPISPRRQSLGEKERIAWDEIQQQFLKTQYWSDGFVGFVCLGDAKIKCLVKSVFELFCMAGYFCFLGLARRRPVRGAIDIAWGVEIRPGELYGPAVVRAYELESEVAQYPRIVVGQKIVQLLEEHRDTSGDTTFIRANRDFSQRCLGMLAQDDDGYWIIHYLGDAFQASVTHSHHSFLYGKARDFVVQQLEERRSEKNSKLAFRYSQLLAYFEAHAPST